LEGRGADVLAIPLDTRDDHSALTVPAARGRDLYAQGLTVFAPRIESFFPEVGCWLDVLRRELGLPPTILSRVFVYLSRGGGVAAPFATNATFVVQLAGRKRWSIAPNTGAPDPTIRYATTMAAVPPMLLDQAPSLQRCGPHDWSELELAPGSALFVPR